MTLHWHRDNLVHIRAGLRTLLPAKAGLAALDPRLPRSEPLWPEETAAMARAVDKRRLEFAAGRVAARLAMAEIGLPPQAIPMGPDRAPVWPDGITGSISHCGAICIAVVARTSDSRGIGVDVEEDTPLDPDLWDEVCRPDERAWLDAQPEMRRGHLAKRIFCTKEALYKAIHPRIRKVLGFDEVAIDPGRMMDHCILSQGHILCLRTDHGAAPWFPV